MDRKNENKKILNELNELKFFFKQLLKFSAFYLEKQKSFIPKKNFFQAVVNIKTKKLCLPTQFYGKVLSTDNN